MTDSVPDNRGLALPPADYVERVRKEQQDRAWIELFSTDHKPPEGLVVLARDPYGVPWLFGDA